jgi:hypothetical protein
MRIDKSKAEFYTACHKTVSHKRMAASALVAKKPSANGTVF